MSIEASQAAATSVKPRAVEVHGRPMNFIEAGSGPVLLLIHGMAGTCANWESVIEPLAIERTVIAPDFPGHGASAPGGGDYSLGGLAGSIRDLMLALVSSGGLGPDVSPLLRAAALPGADLFISATAGAGSRIGSAIGRGIGAVGLRPNADLAEVARAYATLSDSERRKAFLATLRSVVGMEGQRIAALDRLYLAETLPLLIVWGENDPIIPVEHAREAHAQLPSSRLEIFADTGHVPMLERPGRFIAVLQRFLAETDPTEFDRAEWVARFKAAEN